CPSERWGNSNYTDAPLSSTFGPRQLASDHFRFDFHRGIDIAAPIGTPLFAFADGIVRKAGLDSAYTDPLIQLRHYRPGFDSCTSGAGCYHTNYLHVSTWVVAVGDSVQKGDLIGYTGASSSGFEHVHFEIRDAPAQDAFSAWNRDAIHPLRALAYPDSGAANLQLALDSVNVSDPTRPMVASTIRIPMSVELDLERIELEAYEWQSDGSLQPISQAGEIPVGNTIEESGYWVNPPFYAMCDWNRQYSYKDSSSKPWHTFQEGGTYESPYWYLLPPSYNPNVHLDAQDPDNAQVGLFNGWRLAPNHTNATSSQYVLTVENHALVGTVDAANLCVRIRALDVHANATPWQSWNCDRLPNWGCGDGVCSVGESCDGRDQTATCSNDCRSKTKGKPSSRYCYVNGVCEGPGCL
ncbi:MAG: M23 family metallopeptidase, partial [Candidatus Tectomicrobia bacterium]|nr:M23 family metallopeptidase [Candidatus Tectomicrobia bacterium]